jgi:excisionase family DNA binding protein
MNDYVTAIQAAHILGCSESLIRKRIQSGELSATKRGKRWHILRSELEGQTQPQSTAPIPHSTAPVPQPTASAPLPHHDVSQWREDLCQQIADLTARLKRADEDHAGSRQEAARREAASAQREELSKARIIDLERELTVRDSRVVDIQTEREVEVADLRAQVAVLEAKVREVLEDGKSEAVRLADRIADLVVVHQDMQTRVVELQPVAERVPMLQAAVEEKDAALTERERELGNMRQDIDAIASRPVTGPVFRLLTKGKLRR